MGKNNSMSALQVKTQIHQYLDKVEDEKFLKVVHAMLHTYIEEQQEVVGYNIKGEPLHIEEAKAKYEEGMVAYKRGESQSLEAVKVASKSWLKPTK